MRKDIGHICLAVDRSITKAQVIISERYGDVYIEMAGAHFRPHP